jgi:hypothetical protein
VAFQAQAAELARERAGLLEALARKEAELLARDRGAQAADLAAFEGGALRYAQTTAGLVLARGEATPGSRRVTLLNYTLQVANKNYIYRSIYRPRRPRRGRGTAPGAAAARVRHSAHLTDAHVRYGVHLTYELRLPIPPETVLRSACDQ